MQYATDNTKNVEIMQEQIAINSVLPNILGKFKIPVSVNNLI